MNNTMPYQMSNLMPYSDYPQPYSPNSSVLHELKRHLEKIDRELEYIEKRINNIENILNEKKNIYSSNVTDNNNGLYML